MTTPKSQNPEGKVVACLRAIRLVKQRTIAEAKRHVRTNGDQAAYEAIVADEAALKVAIDAVTENPVNALAAMQRRLEALQRWEPDYEEFGMAMIGDRDGDYVKWADIRTLLRGDGKSEGELNG